MNETRTIHRLGPTRCGAVALAVIAHAQAERRARCEVTAPERGIDPEADRLLRLMSEVDWHPGCVFVNGVYPWGTAEYTPYVDGPHDRPRSKPTNGCGCGK